MKIRSVRHKGLKRFIESDDGRGIRSDMLDRVRKVLTVLIASRSIDVFGGPPGWRVHQLAGDRAGTWSVSVSGNWRITFNVTDDEICDLDLEDYH